MECNTGKEIALSLARLAANACIAYGLRANKPRLSEAEIETHLTANGNRIAEIR